MQTRRDQLHAYRFLTRRALAALVTGEPNAVEPPMRRLTLTTVSGVMIAVLVAAGFALFGFLKPSAGDTWKAQGTIIVERETGARYVYLDDKLDPVLNYSSGVLAVSGNGSSSEAKVVLVDRSDIADTPRGPTIGIDAIPDSLPSAGDLVTGPWTVCSQQQPGRPTQLQARVTMYVGDSTAATPLDSSRSIVVQDVAAQHRYLLYQGQRLQIGSSAVQTLLRIDNVPVLTVGTALLNALEPGPSLTTPSVPGLGAPGPAIDGHPTTVGELVHATDTQQDAVVIGGGVASVNPVQAALLRSVRLPGGRLVATVDTTEDKVLGAAAPAATAQAFLHQFDGLPQSLPAVAATPAAKGNVCVVYPGGSSKAAPQFATTASKLPAFPSSTVVESPTSRSGLADAVVVLPGHAALIRSEDGSPTIFAVCEPGLRYAFANTGLLTAFGYGGARPTALPGQLVQLIRAGHALDPAAARTPVSR